jgi:cell division protein FtsZ
MTELEFAIPREESSIIKVIGVGGGGNNAVNRMHELDVKGVDFIVCNTDSQALLISPVATKITLGASLTEGRGAGNNPEKGKEAAIESLPEIEKVLDNNTKMVFITAGMGGGTGTGAAPVIAKAAKERDILTVAIVSIPFLIEGATRINQALQGINEMKQYVDALLVINNERLNEIYKNMKFTDAFKLADDILATATKGIAEIITVTGYINVDFEDVKTVMKDSGVALMGSATAEGEERDVEAIKQALEFPLLKDNDIKGAKNILLNIISSKGDYELGMSEFGRITNYLKEVVGKDTNTNIIWGTGFDDSLGEKISVTIIATGFDANKELYIKQDKIKVNLLDDDFEEDEFDIDEKEEDINPEIGQNTIELELDFSPSSQTESEIILPNLEPKNYEHMKDLNKLNDTNFLEGLENQPANERMKNIDKD